MGSFDCSGGVGTRAPYPYLNSTVDYIKKAYPKTKYLLSVCTGALLNARAGILDGKRATTNKKAWNFVVPNGPKVKVSILCFNLQRDDVVTLIAVLFVNCKLICTISGSLSRAGPLMATSGRLLVSLLERTQL